MEQPYILMALPCYNEAENLPLLLKAYEELNSRYGALFRVKVLVIDDCSKDNTTEVLANLKLNLDFKVIRHEVNKNLMGGINTAFNAFYENMQGPNPAVAYALMDGDNTHSPYHLPEMLLKIEQGFDVVIASRYRTGSRVCGVSWWRQLLSFGVALLFRFLRNVQGVWDYSCGYRLYSPQIVKELKSRLPDDVVKEKSFACMVELLVKLNIVGARCTEVPIMLRYDQKLGESKMEFRKTILGTFKQLLTLWKVRV